MGLRWQQCGWSGRSHRHSLCNRYRPQCRRWRMRLCGCKLRRITRLWWPGSMFQGWGAWRVLSLRTWRGRLRIYTLMGVDGLRRQQCGWSGRSRRRSLCNRYRPQCRRWRMRLCGCKLRRITRLWWSGSMFQRWGTWRMLSLSTWRGRLRIYTLMGIE